MVLCSLLIHYHLSPFTVYPANILHNISIFLDKRNTDIILMGLIPNTMQFTNVWLLFSIHSPSCKYTAQYIYTSGQKKCTHNGIYSNSRGWTVYLFMTTNFIHSISLVNVLQNISILLDKRNAKIIALIPTREDGQFINSLPALFFTFSQSRECTAKHIYTSGKANNPNGYWSQLIKIQLSLFKVHQ